MYSHVAHALNVLTTVCLWLPLVGALSNDAFEHPAIRGVSFATRFFNFTTNKLEMLNKAFSNVVS